MKGLSPYQERRIERDALLKGAEAEGHLKDLKERVYTAFNDDIFKIPPEEINDFKEAAQAYLDLAEGRDRFLDQFAQDVLALLSPEEKPEE